MVDSGSTDHTIEIAQSFGAKVFIEEWKGFAAQKNSAIDKATGDWILSLDADEEVDSELSVQILHVIFGESRQSSRQDVRGVDLAADASNIQRFWLQRKNYFLGRWIKRGGFWPDPKLRLFRRGTGQFESRLVHEDVQVDGRTATLRHGALLHHSYPTLADYIDHMNRYSSLGAQMANACGARSFSILDIVVRPWATFLYNYFIRLGFS